MYKIHTYPDGGKYIEILAPFTDLTYRINSYEDLFLMKSIKDANPFWETVTIPCMFQQQHDRRFNLGESFELKVVCDFINSLNFKSVKVFHPHSDVTPALLNNSEVIDNYSFIATILPELASIEEYQETGEIYGNLILMSSDAGGFKPLIKLCDKLNWKGGIFSASKSRKYEEGESKLSQFIDKKDFEGKDILIIDDLCVGGGTFKGLSKMLKERNCGKLYLAISHITLQELGSDPVTNYFEKVFTTNSKFGNEEYLVDGNTSLAGIRLEVINLF